MLYHELINCNWVNRDHLPLTSVKNLAYSSESLRLSMEAMLARMPKVTRMNMIEKKNFVMYENEVSWGVGVGWINGY